MERVPKAVRFSPPIKQLCYHLIHGGMEIIVIAFAAFLASLLTFFSGFRLGTTLLPVMSIFFPVEAAVLLTAVVHFSHNLFKLGLIGKHVSRHVLLLFGLPAIGAAVGGAFLLRQLSGWEPLYRYELLGNQYTIEPLALIVGLLIVFFAVLDELPFWEKLEQKRWHLAGGGVLSGFFGGLSGHQGALRSLFLVQSGLGKEAFIATSVAIAMLIDTARLPVYLADGFAVAGQEWDTLLIAVGAAFLGVLIGRFFLKKVTFGFVKKFVLVLLIVMGLGLAAGIL